MEEAQDQLKKIRENFIHDEFEFTEGQLISLPDALNLDLSTAIGVDYYNTLAEFYLYHGNYQEALNQASKGRYIAEQLNDYILQAKSLILQTQALHRMYKINEAKVYLDHLDSLIDRSNITDQSIFMDYKYMKSTYLIRIGEYTDAMDILNKCLEMQKLRKDGEKLNRIYNAIGIIHKELGYLDKAIEALTKSIEIILPSKKQIRIFSPIVNLASVYLDRGDRNKAVVLYQEGLDLASNLGTVYQQSYCLFHLALITTNIGKKENAKVYLDKLSSLTDNLTIIPIRRDCAQAIFLKRFGRLHEVVRAKNILEGIIEKENIEFSVKILAIKHLCEIKIIEFQSSEDPDVFIQIKHLITIYKENVLLTKSAKLSIDVLILQARLCYIEGEFDDMNRLFTQADSIAEKYDLTLQQQIVSDERKKWSEPVQKSDAPSTMSTRIKDSEILDYIKKLADVI